MSTAELNSKFQPKLKSVLLPEEEVQWTGQSQAFPLVCRENRSALLLRWIVCAVCAIALSILYTVWAIRSGSYNIIVELIIIVAFAYGAILVPVLDRHNLMKNTLYCITNKRVLVFVGDRPPVALNRTGLKSRCVAGENGCVHILFGASIDTKPHRYRLTTISPQTDKSGDIPVGTVFYHIKKEDVPRDILTFS